MKYTEIVKKNRELGSKLTSKEYKIALVSNITITQLKDFIELSLREESINAVVTVGDYDAIVQDSIKFSAYDAVMVFWEAGNFIDGIQNSSYSMSSKVIEALAQRVESEINYLLNNLKFTPLVLINRFSSKVFCSDVLGYSPLSILCNRLNQRVSELVLPNQIIVDLDCIFAQVGIDKSVDFRQFQSSMALYSTSFLRAFANTVKPAFLAATGRSKKVLVLDCDNTLWGGIVGEDGFEGIELSKNTLKGKAYCEVQTILKGLKTEGVLLALCSKNNLADVEKVFAENKDMILQENDIAAKKVNWQDKASNLCELAAELNLGLDSFVFVDDSPFEIGLIQNELPQVKCVLVPQNLSEYPSMMRRLRSSFFSLNKTNEDNRKTEMYLQEQQRKEHATSFSSIHDYLTSLELKIEIDWGSRSHVARAAQLSQKTNQFNLTTKRYTEADICRMLDDPSFHVITFNVSDLYGDYGTVGMVIVELVSNDQGIYTIDSFLMSCRIIGRNIEFRVFDEIISVLKNSGVPRINSSYVATAKNSQVASLYDKIGFDVVAHSSQCKEYSLNLQKYIPHNFNYIEIRKDL